MYHILPVAGTNGTKYKYPLRKQYRSSTVVFTGMPFSENRNAMPAPCPCVGGIGAVATVFAPSVHDALAVKYSPADISTCNECVKRQQTHTQTTISQPLILVSGGRRVVAYLEIPEMILRLIW